MKVGLGDADAAVGIGLEVVTDFLAELMRIGRLPNRQELTRDVGGVPFEIVVLADSLVEGLNQSRFPVAGFAPRTPTGPSS